jgi:hypothetical protein
MCMRVYASLRVYRVGQNHIYTVYIRYFWQKNHRIYGVYIRTYTVLANPTCMRDYVHACMTMWGGARDLLGFAAAAWCIPSLT